MNFQWWWGLIAVVAFWIIGWSICVIGELFFDPLVSKEERRKDFRYRLLGSAVLNWFLWPWMLRSGFKWRKFHRDMQTGKRPAWLICAEGEFNAWTWTLSDGTEFEAYVNHLGSLSEPSDISCDYKDDSLNGEIQYRVRMIAPTPKPVTDWAPLEFWPRGLPPEPDDDPDLDEDDDEDDEDNKPIRYHISTVLPRGKYAVEFRVTNRSGKIEECSSVTLIVADEKDYDL